MIKLESYYIAVWNTNTNFNYTISYFVIKAYLYTIV